MAFDESISMHRKCLSICGYTSLLRQMTFIEMVINGKGVFWFRRITQWAFDESISMHRKCLSICRYTSLLRQMAFIEMVFK